MNFLYYVQEYLAFLRSGWIAQNRVLDFLCNQIIFFFSVYFFLQIPVNIGIVIHATHKGVVSITVIISIISCCFLTINGFCFFWYSLPPRELGFIHNPLTHNLLWDLVRITKLIYFRTEWIKVQSLLWQITVRLWLNNHVFIDYFYEFAYNSSKLNLTLHSTYWFELWSLQLFTYVNIFHSFSSI